MFEKINSQRSSLLVILAMVPVVLSGGCAPNAAGQLNKTSTGTIIGGAGGAAAGYTLTKSPIGGFVGGLLGGFIGNRIGNSMDEQDLALQQQTFQTTMETAKTGIVRTWKNPDSGNRGSVVVERTYYVTRDNSYCREFMQKVIINGQEQSAHGTACRQPDGSWKITSGA